MATGLNLVAKGLILYLPICLTKIAIVSSLRVPRAATPQQNDLNKLKLLLCSWLKLTSRFYAYILIFIFTIHQTLVQRKSYKKANKNTRKQEAKVIQQRLHRMTPRAQHVPPPSWAARQTDWRTDTANIDNNSLHHVHSTQPKNTDTDLEDNRQGHLRCNTAAKQQRAKLHTLVRKR